MHEKVPKRSRLEGQELANCYNWARHWLLGLLLLKYQLFVSQSQHGMISYTSLWGNILRWDQKIEGKIWEFIWGKKKCGKFWSKVPGYRNCRRMDFFWWWGWKENEKQTELIYIFPISTLSHDTTYMTWIVHCHVPVDWDRDWRIKPSYLVTRHIHPSNLTDRLCSPIIRKWIILSQSSTRSKMRICPPTPTVGWYGLSGRLLTYDPIVG